MREGISYFAALLLSAGAASCSAGTTDHPSPPSNATFEVQFPSTAAEVGAETIQAFVYANPSSMAMTDCEHLIVARQTMNNLPPAEAQTSSIAMCDLLADATKGQVPNVPYGQVAVLVVTQRKGADYFTGCASGPLSQSGTPISVILSPAKITTPIPSTNCQNASDICAMPPKCCVACDGGV